MTIRLLCSFALIALTLSGCGSLPAPGSSAVRPDPADAYQISAVTFGREKLKGTTKTQGDFNLAHRFTVEIDGVAVGGIAKVQGLEAAIAAYKDGEDAIVHRRPGRPRYGNLVLKRGRSSGGEFYKWRQSVLKGHTERKSVSIIQHDREATRRYNFFDCWPTRWKGPELNAKNSAHATETLEIAFERFEMK